MKKITFLIIAVLVLSLSLVIGCTRTKYLCPDGTTVDRLEECSGGVEVPDEEPPLDEEGCTKKEAYTVEVPYEDSEYYFVKVGVGEKFCEARNYDNTLERSTPYMTTVDGQEKWVCRVSITNNENESGEWKASVKFITTTSGGGPESEEITRTIEAKSTETFMFYLELEEGKEVSECVPQQVSAVWEDCHYSFYSTEKKKRTVTKYRNETKYRMVPC
ncbi:hypothetical protein KY339_01545 [Candidatus Woesearchaeota archaeon]|nr:hypothetical protein [Candidatus Woesearchaeota archaeon]